MRSSTTSARTHLSPLDRGTGSPYFRKRNSPVPTGLHILNPDETIGIEYAFFQDQVHGVDLSRRFYTNTTNADECLEFFIKPNSWHLSSFVIFVLNSLSRSTLFRITGPR